MKIWKGKSEGHETVDDVTRTYLNDNVMTQYTVPLIVVFTLICLITTIIIVGTVLNRPTEIAEQNKDIDTNEEQISAETITNYGSYTVPKDGIYKIELHGGHGTDSQGNYAGGNGSKVTGYAKLSSGDVLTATRYEGGTRCYWVFRKRR